MKDNYRKSTLGGYKMKLGFIGCGNMGEAMLHGAIDGKFAVANEIIVSTHSKISSEALQKKYGIVIGSNIDVAKSANIIILAIKPNIYPTIFAEIKNIIPQDTIIISITTGFTLQNMTDALNGHQKVVRTMPNTPALVGSAVTAVTYASEISDEEKATLKQFFESFGKMIEVTEEQMIGVGSVSGSSPAFIYMFIEALADGAVKYGIPREDAYKFAALAVEGSAKMVLETGKHPASLKDAVTSPGGTTIEGVITLEKNGFKGNIVEAMEATADKFIAELHKNK